MLRDQRRTKSFLEAVRNVVSPGDVVIDIGTGTGILAAAAAQAGARHVYAVEIGGRVSSRRTDSPIESPSSAASRQT
jgi:predicted RNA methylase